jgi:catabolite regulation protein CreA
MAMYKLPVSDLLQKVLNELKERYPKESFLEEELQSIVRGLITSLRWIALEQAEQHTENGKLTTSVSSIVTSDHFALGATDRQNIIERIVYTSGLDEAMAKVALNTIENEVDNCISLGGVVEVEFIGEIRSATPPEYVIDLDESLQIKPFDANAEPYLVAGNR